MIMAGGQGERLYPLTKKIAKPAVTFGGIYRIIDFTLSNCLNSEIRRIYLLTQYSNATLDKHIRLGWNIFNQELGEFIENIPPQKIHVDWWYRGTADAIYQNINILDHERPDHVLVLSGDHVYRMDYRKMINVHKAKRSDATIACVALDRESCRQMGVMQIDPSYRVIGFQEKPAYPKPIPTSPSKALASMGVYVFRTEPLVRALAYDAKRETEHDFGKNIIPRMIKKHNVFAYSFKEDGKKEPMYWRDVGSLDAYYQAHNDLLGERPAFGIHDINWPLRTYQEQMPPSQIFTEQNNKNLSSAKIVNSIVSNGCLIKEACISRSILSPFVQVHTNASVEQSILMKGVTVGHRAKIRKAIIDEGVNIPPDYTIGFNLKEDSKRFSVTESGIVVVPEGSIID